MPARRATLARECAAGPSHRTYGDRADVGWWSPASARPAAPARGRRVEPVLVQSLPDCRAFAWQWAATRGSRCLPALCLVSEPG
ncbi:MAG TPA: hypothetical protein VMV92_40415 [Streptosporangiaceae bacterium]|nr:hypothetical protein [Streptosporangiaceae bacterium]